MYKRLILFFELRPARLLTCLHQGSKGLWMEFKVVFPQWPAMDKDFIETNKRSQKVGSTSLKDTRQNLKAFQEAVNNRDRQEIHRLLSIGVNINALNEAGDTPLHQCIRDGRIESAKLLVEFGADVKRTNRDGWSPVHLATFLGQREMAMYLLDK